MNPAELSGRPLFKQSTRFLAKCFVATEGKLPLIGVGGINSGAAALSKIRAGASLIQLYTGLVYEGPTLLPDIQGSAYNGNAGNRKAARLAYRIGS